MITIRYFDSSAGEAIDEIVAGLDESCEATSVFRLAPDSHSIELDVTEYGPCGRESSRFLFQCNRPLVMYRRSLSRMIPRIRIIERGYIHVEQMDDPFYWVGFGDRGERGDDLHIRSVGGRAHVKLHEV